MKRRYATSKDRIGVDIKIEAKKEKSVGRDFVSGGYHDYRATSSSGYLITVKPAPTANPNIAKEILSKSLQDMGIKAFVMDPAYVSGIITAELDTIPNGLGDNGIIEGIAEVYEQSSLKSSTISRAKKAITNSKPTMKALVISKDVYEELEKARLKTQDLEMKECDMSQFITSLLKNYKTK